MENFSSKAKHLKLPQCFNQIKLNGFVRDLGLSKQAAELLGSQLKKKNLLVTAWEKFPTSEQEMRTFVNFFQFINQS